MTTQPLPLRERVAIRMSFEEAVDLLGELFAGGTAFYNAASKAASASGWPQGRLEAAYEQRYRNQNPEA